jgi:putative ABC transport system permease protein
MWNMFKTRVRSLVLRKRAEMELDEELRTHIEREIERKVNRGVPTEAARREALSEFGRFESLKEECREARGLQLLDGLMQDLRYGSRILIKAPGFLFAVVLTLGIGIGANTAIFSIVYAVLWKPLPYTNADRIVALWEVPPAGSSRATAVQPTSSVRRRTGWQGELEGGGSPELAPADIVDIRNTSRLLSVVAGAAPYSYALIGSGEPEALTGFNVTRGFFELAGIRAAVGRTFLPDEYKANNPARVVILSYALWQSRFGGNPTIVGSQLRLNDQPYTVVGVMPRAFRLPVGGYYSDIQVWAPHNEPGYETTVRASSFWPALALLAPNVTINQAQQELDAISSRLAEQYPATNAARRFRAVPLRQHLVGTLRPVLLVLLGAVGTLLLIGCANVACLLLVRGMRRRREVSVRLALGASRGRILRQLMAESGLIAGAGAFVGVAIAYGLIPVLLALNPATSPLFDGVAVDGTVLLFCAGLSTLTAIGFGLGPAFNFLKFGRQPRLDVGSVAVGERMQAKRARSALVVVQIGLSVTLLAGAGLLVRTLTNLLAIDPGFRTERILSAQVSLNSAVDSEPERDAFIRRVAGRMAALPGVVAAAAVSNMPLHETPVDYRDVFSIEGLPSKPDDAQQRTLHTVATPDYFATMGIALRSGRVFDESDTAQTERVAVVNETMARHIWPGASPIGSRLRLGFPVRGVVRVVGVVQDVKHSKPDGETEFEVYVSHRQVPIALMTFVIRTSLESAALAGSVRNILREELPNVPLGPIATMEHFRTETFRAERFRTFVLTAFALAASLLAAAGLYGLMSYSVAMQRGEIALRMALGAHQHQVVFQTLRQGAQLAVFGVALGIAVALIATRLLSGMLFHVTATDLVTYLGISAFTVLVVAPSCFIPALRASRVNPARALRSE